LVVAQERYNIPRHLRFTEANVLLFIGHAYYNQRYTLSALIYCITVSDEEGLALKGGGGSF